MPAPRSRRRARLATLVSVVLAITGFQFFLAPQAAQAAGGTGLVISEVYGAGGNAGATCTTPTSSSCTTRRQLGAVDDGLSVQYRSRQRDVGAPRRCLTGTHPGGRALPHPGGAAAQGGTADSRPRGSPGIAMAAGGRQVILGVGNAVGTGDLGGRGRRHRTWWLGTATARGSGAGQRDHVPNAALALTPKQPRRLHRRADVHELEPGPDAGHVGRSATRPASVGQAITRFTVTATGGTVAVHLRAPTGTLPAGVSINAHHWRRSPARPPRQGSLQRRDHRQPITGTPTHRSAARSPSPCR